MVDSKWFDVVEELEEGVKLVTIAACSIILTVGGDWDEWDYNSEEYFYFGFDEGVESSEDALRSMEGAADCDFILHEYGGGITTDYSEEEGLLWNVYESGGAEGTRYSVRNGVVSLAE